MPVVPFVPLGEELHAPSVVDEEADDGVDPLRPPVAVELGNPLGRDECSALHCSPPATSSAARSARHVVSSSIGGRWGRPRRWGDHACRRVRRSDGQNGPGDGEHSCGRRLVEHAIPGTPHVLRPCRRGRRARGSRSGTDPRTASARYSISPGPQQVSRTYSCQAAPTSNDPSPTPAEDPSAKRVVPAASRAPYALRTLTATPPISIARSTAVRSRPTGTEGRGSTPSSTTATMSARSSPSEPVARKAAGSSSKSFGQVVRPVAWMSPGSRRTTAMRPASLGACCPERLDRFDLGQSARTPPDAHHRFDRRPPGLGEIVVALDHDHVDG